MAVLGRQGEHAHAIRLQGRREVLEDAPVLALVPGVTREHTCPDDPECAHKRDVQTRCLLKIIQNFRMITMLLIYNMYHDSQKCATVLS